MNLSNIFVISTMLCLSLVACADSGAPAPISIAKLDNSYNATLAEGIDFSQKPGYPVFIKAVTGLSRYEKMGRWTEGKEVVFDFKQNLPPKFILNLDFAPALGPNVGKTVQIQVGDWMSAFIASDKPANVWLIVKSTIPTHSIKFVVPAPLSPAEIGIGEDTRKIGLMFKHLSIVTDDPIITAPESESLAP
jgi:hypothetical protein